jgi:hypothetical protein
MNKAMLFTGILMLKPVLPELPAGHQGDLTALKPEICVSRTLFINAGPADLFYRPKCPEE